ncbi:MAG TPA: TetR/AcrR family transcriptional regulator [Solirubrobacterales bacterium]|jgi:AcrR family transcriptional regulator|nr:TetR/AcrR family transcriptional regulator [Solirubrobacterales bacterium]
MAATIPPSRPALRARYEGRRKALIDTAAEAFARGGYRETSIADLSDATGLAAGGIYHYIGSKENLLIAICDDLLAPLLERAREIVASGEPPERQLRDLLRTWLAHIETHRAHMLVFAQERHLIEGEPQWRTVRRQRKHFEELLDQILEAGEADGSMAFEDRGLALLGLLGMVNYTPQWLRPHGRLSGEEVADGWCDLILRSARP